MSGYRIANHANLLFQLVKVVKSTIRGKLWSPQAYYTSGKYQKNINIFRTDEKNAAIELTLWVSVKTSYSKT